MSELRTIELTKVIKEVIDNPELEIRSNVLEQTDDERVMTFLKKYIDLVPAEYHNVDWVLKALSTLPNGFNSRGHKGMALTDSCNSILKYTWCNLSNFYKSVGEQAYSLGVDIEDMPNEIIYAMWLYYLSNITNRTATYKDRSEVILNWVRMYKTESLLYKDVEVDVSKMAREFTRVIRQPRVNIDEEIGAMCVGLLNASDLRRSRTLLNNAELVLGHADDYKIEFNSIGKIAILQYLVVELYVIDHSQLELLYSAIEHAARHSQKRIKHGPVNGRDVKELLRIVGLSLPELVDTFAAILQTWGVKVRSANALYRPTDSNIAKPWMHVVINYVQLYCERIEEIKRRDMRFNAYYSSNRPHKHFVHNVLKLDDCFSNVTVRMAEPLSSEEVYNEVFRLYGLR